MAWHPPEGATYGAESQRVHGHPPNLGVTKLIAHTHTGGDLAATVDDLRAIFVRGQKSSLIFGPTGVRNKFYVY